MHNPIADAAAEEAKVEKRIKDAARHREVVNDIGYETRATGPITGHGKHRRHKLGQSHAALAAFLRKPSAFALAFMSQGNNLTWNDLPKLLEHMAHHFHVAMGDEARHTEILTHEEFSYIYKTVGVSEEVRQQLETEAAEIGQLELLRDAEYAAGQYGPLGVDFSIFKLSDLYKMRSHPLTGEMTFSESRVQELQAQAGPCVGDVCPVVVYTAIPTSSLRGIHVRAADPNSQDDIKIAPSEEANKIAAAPMRVPPQQLNFHLNG